MTTSNSRLRRWLGPTLIVAAPLQYLAGNSILLAHHARPLNVWGAIGIVVVISSLLVLIAGLGESFNVVAQHFTRRT